MFAESLEHFDPEIFDALRKETEREQEKLVLVASENYASKAVLEAQGSVFTNKYAEGYPAAGTTEAASTLMRLRTLPASGPRPSSVRDTPTCSPTAEPRRTWAP